MTSDTKYVVTRLRAGLGNQLFQYAASRALAHRIAARLILDCTNYRIESRKFELDCYPIQADVSWNGPLKIHRRRIHLPGRIGRSMADAINRRMPQWISVDFDGRRFKLFNEFDPFEYDTRFDRLTGSVYLLGYWQSHRYFEDAAAMIRNELQPKSEPTGRNHEWLCRIRQSNSTCIHVRRGDYLKQVNSKNALAVCPASYFRDAMQYVRGHVPDTRFFIFSDDWSWCRENLSIADAMLVDANGPDDANEELRLMAACRHHIISNSSFSWWAAWLAYHPEQIVVAPMHWR